jgi:outer membrane protein assembly factor BamD (BamD/ComL family)
MQSAWPKWIGFGLACGLAALALPTDAREPYRETVGKKGWFIFGRTAKPTASEQWAYAEQLEQAGRTGAAARQYLRLITRWPQAPEAGPAQYRYAQWVDHKGKLLRAFDEYQRLFDRFTGQFPYHDVMARQFQIADELMHKKKGRFLFLPGFAAPERAIPLFEKIIANGPGGEKAPEAQFLIGRAHEMAREYEEAISAYLTTQNRYPDSATAEESGFNAAMCYYRLTLENPNDEQLLENAWAALSVFLSRYPASDKCLDAETHRFDLYSRRADLAYRRAYFYDRIARRSEAALIAYRAFLKQFPSSEWAAEAHGRVQVLAEKVEGSHDP